MQLSHIKIQSYNRCYIFGIVYAIFKELAQKYEDKLFFCYTNQMHNIKYPVNSRGTTPTSFGRDAPSSESILR